MIKRITAFILIAILAFSAASCSAAEEPPEVTDTGTAAETAADTSYSANYLPEADYDGYEFRMITTSDLLCVADVEEMNGEVLNDAFYTRNRKIEDMYNINLVQVGANGWDAQQAILTKSVTAASDDFDLIRLILREAFASSVKGYIAPFDSLPYCDETQPWYLPYMNNELEMDGKLFFAYTAECLGTYMYTSCIYFNMNMFDDLGLTYPYEAVAADNWTMDKFFSQAASAVSDINGDNIIDEKNDIVGYAGVFDLYVSSFWVNAGFRTVVKDDSGLPVFSMSDSFYTMLKKLFDYWSQDGIFYDAYYEAGGGFAEGWNLVRDTFVNNHALFYCSAVDGCQDLRDMNDDFGLVPYPKYTEDQGGYYGNTIDGYVNIVPVHALNLERTSVILEMLAVESMNYIMPAYVEKALEAKALRDEKSVEMLAIVLGNRTLDLGVTVWYSTIRSAIVDTCFAKGSDNFASSVEKNQKKIDSAIKAVTDVLTGNN